MWNLLKRIHRDDRGAVSIETILIIAAIAIPILIFILKFGWPKIRDFFNEGIVDDGLLLLFVFLSPPNRNPRILIHINIVFEGAVAPDILIVGALLLFEVLLGFFGDVTGKQFQEGPTKDPEKQDQDQGDKKDPTEKLNDDHDGVF